MNDDDFEDLLVGYLEPPSSPNPAMDGVRIVWIHDHPGYGAMHIAENGVTEQEVTEVLLETPPMVEAKRHREDPNRTMFWGATSGDRWLFVVCEDWVENGERCLLPITAFEPDEGELYWRRQ